MQALSIFILGLLASSYSYAQAGDQDFEELSVIALPEAQAAEPSPSLPVQWSCEGLLVSEKARYRKADCDSTSSQAEAVELEIESHKADEDAARHSRNSQIY